MKPRPAPRGDAETLNLAYGNHIRTQVYTTHIMHIIHIYICMNIYVYDYIDVICMCIYIYGKSTGPSTNPSSRAFHTWDLQFLWKLPCIILQLHGASGPGKTGLYFCCRLQRPLGASISARAVLEMHTLVRKQPTPKPRCEALHISFKSCLVGPDAVLAGEILASASSCSGTPICQDALSICISACLSIHLSIYLCTIKRGDAAGMSTVTAVLLANTTTRRRGTGSQELQTEKFCEATCGFFPC